MKKTAVVILNYNAWRESIQEAEQIHKVCDVAWEDMIMIDNASTDDSWERLSESQHQGYQLLRSEKNGGYASGNNIALKYAAVHGYDYAWILNNDILVEDKEILEKMTVVLEKDKFVAVVNPDIYAPDGHLFNRDAIRPTFFDLTLGMLQYRRKGRLLTDRGGYGYVYRPQGCCMLCNLEKLQQVDYLDEHTFLYCEEIILAERLLKYGYRCACCTDTKVIHNHSNTVKNNIQQKKILEIKRESFQYYLTQYRNYGKLQSRIAGWFDTLKWKMLG